MTSRLIFPARIIIPLLLLGVIGAFVLSKWHGILVILTVAILTGSCCDTLSGDGEARIRRLRNLTSEARRNTSRLAVCRWCEVVLHEQRVKPEALGASGGALKMYAGSLLGS
jgi:hypothetical protein